MLKFNHVNLTVIDVPGLTTDPTRRAFPAKEDS
jgi:hypothetical protein